MDLQRQVDELTIELEYEREAKRKLMRQMVQQTLSYNKINDENNRLLMELDEVHRMVHETKEQMRQHSSTNRPSSDPGQMSQREKFLVSQIKNQEEQHKRMCEQLAESREQVTQYAERLERAEAESKEQSSKYQAIIENLKYKNRVARDNNNNIISMLSESSKCFDTLTISDDHPLQTPARLPSSTPAPTPEPTPKKLYETANEILSKYRNAPYKTGSTSSGSTCSSLSLSPSSSSASSSSSSTSGGGGGASGNCNGNGRSSYSSTGRTPKYPSSNGIDIRNINDSIRGNSSSSTNSDTSSK
ncbi:hypothetical protein SAMD00019534_001410 [Acytostelium subglobosum LB1]|uniref:hypothetical protein n=1 Tax=Acytostelium subglobosum LB1 TaxID=1410327 RepID=UPI000644FDC7|nr:hypothetical protein SAMD00019534_001410 [Acytostelium subglobosum LB1]GAM16966.1 hypothetical protein SAMD00019534_001410 [Acytostelium subglobosum LB1]|eukprot:XP_012759028.1 hypothetical protein SAMD00019534_001410 [Acytostelium subglobosum LB1]